MAGLLLLSLAAILSTGPLAGQSQRGSLVGSVADASDAVIPKARVEVTHEATGGRFQAETGNDGFYTVLYLPYGRFTVAVNAPGFKTYTLTGVEVAAATQTTLNVALSVESQTQEVRIEAAAALLEAHTSAISTNVEQRLKDEIPVGNRRNPLAYLTLVPGFQPSTQSTFGGGRYGSNNILLDGQAPDVSVTSQGDFGNPSLPSVEAIGEFVALLNSVPAEYGRTGGPTISFATRSGSNDLHGAAYEYYDNQVFNARPWQAGRRAEGHQHFFGATAGGPVRIPKFYNGRNKSFFFVDYSDIRQSDAGTVTNITTLPTANMRRGDFGASDILPIFDPLTLAADAQGNQRRQAFPGNQIPLTRLSAVSRSFLDRLPTATHPGSLNNFVGSLPPQAQTQWLLFVKGDHYVSERDRLSGSYQAGRPRIVGSSILGDAFGELQSTNFNRYRLDWSHSFSPSLSHLLLVGVTRQTSSNSSRNFGQNFGQAAGLRGLFDPNCPRIEVDRAQQGSFTMCFNLAQLQAVTNSTFNYSMMWQKGSHSLKWGADFIRFNSNNNARSSAILNAAGAYNFGGLNPRPSASTISQNATSQTDNTGGNSWGDFYLGLPKVAHAAEPAILGYRQGYFGAFIQDDWRISSKLTINAGLRWDLNVPYSEVNGQISRFDIDMPNPAAGGLPGALLFLGKGQGRTGTNLAGNYHFKAFAPRLGFAYRAAPKTVFRGFVGVLYHGMQNANIDFAERVGFQASGEPLPPANRFAQYYSWDRPFPAEALVNTRDASLRNGQGVQAQDPNGVARAPKSYMWSANIQQELKGNILVDLSYIANNMKNGTDRFPLNALPEQYWKLGRLLDLPLNNPQVVAAGYRAPYAGFDVTQPLFQALRPFPQYLNVIENATNATSSTYHAFIVKVQKRYSNGLSFLGNYTVSKFITDSQWAPGAFGAGPSVPNNRKLDKGLYRFDIPQRLVLSYSYDLPFGRGKKWLSHSRMVDLAVGGWTFTGLHQYQRGQPAAFGGSFNTLIPTIGGRADRVANVPTRSSISCGDLVHGDPSRNYVFNAGNPAQAARTGRPLAFAPAGEYQVGNTPRIDPKARQCGRMNEDFALFKSFAIKGDSIRFRVGAESFNVFNRHTWMSGETGPAVTAADFGEVLPFQPYGPRTVRLKFRVEW